MSKKTVWILISVAAVLLAALVVLLIIIGGVKNTDAPSQPAESTQQTAGQEDAVIDDAEPTESAADSGNQTAASTAPVQPTQPSYPLGDFEEGVEVWQDTQPATQPAPSAAATEPSKPPETLPAQPEGDKTLSYEAYLQLSSAEKQTYFRSFENVEAFYEWLNVAQAEYEKEHPGGSGSGSVDIGDYIP